MSKIEEDFESGKYAVSDLSKKDAEAIAMAINMVFGNAKMFSPKHPSTERSAKKLCEIISNLKSQNPLISFIKSGKSFYVEKWLVDSKINHGRFTQDFGKLLIESISFEKDTTVRNIMDFIGFFINALESNNIKANKIQEMMEQKGESGIALNYITFQKIAKGDKVVSANDIVAAEDEIVVKKDLIPEKLRANQTSEIPFDQILEMKPIKEEKSQEQENIISHLKKLFNIKNIVGGNSSPQIENDLSLVNKELNSINSEIKEQENTENIDYDTLFNSLVDVSKIVKSAEFLFNEQKAESKKIISQIDQMTINAVLGIIKKEIKQKTFSIKKLALVVKRLDPSKEDLQIMLPQIKTSMINAGLNISDYLDFVMELGNKLSEDKAIGKIFDKADDFGVKPTEIVEAFSQNPQECVKLLLQSAEIQKQHTSQINLSDYLAKMIDDISRDIAMQKIKTKKIGGDVHSVISSVISSVNDGILAKFKENGLDFNTANEIQKELMEKFPQTLEKLKNEWLVNTLVNTKNLTQDAIVKVLTQVSNTNESVEKYEQILTDFGKKFNLSPNEINQILTNANKQKELTEQKKGLPLLQPKTTIHFIKRYIEEYKRFKHPFSIIMISEKDTAISQTDEVFNIAEKVAFLLSESFRLLDISGFLKIRGKEIAVIILPMTASNSLNKVLEKIDTIIDTKKHILTSIFYELPSEDESYDIVMKKLLRGHF